MNTHETRGSVQGGKRIDLEKDGLLNVDSLLGLQTCKHAPFRPRTAYSPEHLSCLLVIIVLPVLQIVDIDKEASESGLSTIRNLSAPEMTCDCIYR